MNRKLLFIPLFLFLALAAAFLVQLTRNANGDDPTLLESALIGKPVPVFKLESLAEAGKTYDQSVLRDGKPLLLNVWATWCVSCREEHPILVELAKNKNVPIVGLNYKEVRGDGSLDADKIAPDAEKKLALERANGWLNEHGNPYVLSALDLDGRVGIDYGVYGVPETYIIDKAGVIRMKHTGPVTPEILAKKIMPLLAELNK